MALTIAESMGQPVANPKKTHDCTLAMGYGGVSQQLTLKSQLEVNKFKHTFISQMDRSVNQVLANNPPRFLSPTNILNAFLALNACQHCQRSLTAAELQESHKLMIAYHCYARVNTNTSCERFHQVNYNVADELLTLQSRRLVKTMFQKQEFIVVLTHCESTNEDDTREDEYNERSSSQNFNEFSYKKLSPEASQNRHSHEIQCCNNKLYIDMK